MSASAIIPLFDRRRDGQGNAKPTAEDRDAPDRGIPIRAISRAVAVLQAINRAGPLNMTEIAHASEVPYPTACRIVQTLLHENLIEREEGRKRYRPTALVQTLSHGFDGHGELLQAARPHMAAMTREIGWPVSLSTHVGSSMVLRDSTHTLTSLTFSEYHPGYSMPILECASGLVYLAWCPERERRTILRHLSANADEETGQMVQLAFDGGLLESIRQEGYAARGHNRFTRNPGKTSSLAVPVLQDGRIVAALCVAFFASAVEMQTAKRELVPRLKASAEAIGDALEKPGLSARNA